jgi:hypothetical protein
MKNMKDSPEQWETMLEIRELLEKYCQLQPKVVPGVLFNPKFACP